MKDEVTPNHSYCKLSIFFFYIQRIRDVIDIHKIQDGTKRGTLWYTCFGMELRCSFTFKLRFYCPPAKVFYNHTVKHTR